MNTVPFLCFCSLCLLSLFGELNPPMFFLHVELRDHPQSALGCLEGLGANASGPPDPTQQIQGSLPFVGKKTSLEKETNPLVRLLSCFSFR